MTTNPDIAFLHGAVKALTERVARLEARVGRRHAPEPRGCDDIQCELPSPHAGECRFAPFKLPSKDTP